MCEYRTDGTYIGALARANNPTWGLINANNPMEGVRMHYSNGDRCAAINMGSGEAFPVMRQTTFNFYCNLGAGQGYISNIVDDADTCSVTVNFHSQHACPSTQPVQGGVPPVHPGVPAGNVQRRGAAERWEDEVDGGSSGWLFVEFFVVAVMLYVVVGYALNNHRKGAVGLEALPHITFWMQLPGLVTDGCYYSYYRVAALVGGLPVANRQEYVSVSQHDTEANFL